MAWSTTQNWPTLPRTSIGLLVLVALLHVFEHLVQSTLRTIKTVFIFLVIFDGMKSSTLGTGLLCKGKDLVLAATQRQTPSTNQYRTVRDLYLWLERGRRICDAAYCTLGYIMALSKTKSAVMADGKADECSLRDMPAIPMRAEEDTTLTLRHQSCEAGSKTSDEQDSTAQKKGSIGTRRDGAGRL